MERQSIKLSAIHLFNPLGGGHICGAVNVFGSCEWPLDCSSQPHCAAKNTMMWHQSRYLHHHSLRLLASNDDGCRGRKRGYLLSMEHPLHRVSEQGRRIEDACTAFCAAINEQYVPPLSLTPPPLSFSAVPTTDTSQQTTVTRGG